jgi:hypothetical protein
MSMRNLNNIETSPYGLIDSKFNESFHKVERVYESLTDLNTYIDNMNDLDVFVENVDELHTFVNNINGLSVLMQKIDNIIQVHRNVKDYGAIGNGTADDTIAIQTCLDLGGNIYFPPGTYLVSGVTVTKNYTRLYGAGGLSKIKLKNGSNKAVITVMSTPTNSFIFHPIIELLYIEGNRFNQTSGSNVDGILLRKSINARILNVEIYDCYQTGIRLLGTPIVLTVDTWIINCKIYDCLENGIDMSSYSATLLAQGNIIGPINKNVEGSKACIYIDNVDARIIGNHCFAGRQANIFVTGSANNAQILDNHFESARKHGIELVGAKNVIIKGNLVVKNSRGNNNAATYSGIYLRISDVGVKCRNITIVGNCSHSEQVHEDITNTTTYNQSVSNGATFTNTLSLVSSTTLYEDVYTFTLVDNGVGTAASSLVITLKDCSLTKNELATALNTALNLFKAGTNLSGTSTYFTNSSGEYSNITFNFITGINGRNQTTFRTLMNNLTITKTLSNQFSILNNSGIVFSTKESLLSIVSKNILTQKYGIEIGDGALESGTIIGNALHNNELGGINKKFLEGIVIENNTPVTDKKALDVSYYDIYANTDETKTLSIGIEASLGSFFQGTVAMFDIEIGYNNYVGSVDPLDLGGFYGTYHLIITKKSNSTFMYSLANVCKTNTLPTLSVAFAYNTSTSALLQITVTGKRGIIINSTQKRNNIPLSYVSVEQTIDEVFKYALVAGQDSAFNRVLKTAPKEQFNNDPENIYTYGDGATLGFALLTSNGGQWFSVSQNKLMGQGWLKYKDAIKKLQTKTLAKIIKIIWDHGEGDFITLVNSTNPVISFPRYYKRALKAIYTQTRVYLPTVEIYVTIPAGTLNDGTSWDGSTPDKSAQTMREIYFDIIDELNYVKKGAERFDLEYLPDSILLTDASYVTLAARDSHILNGGGIGPEVTNVVLSGSTLTITITHDGGTDFTPTTNIQGFYLTNNRSAIPLTNVNRVSATTITATLSSTPSGSKILYYVYGNKGVGITDLTKILRDDSSMNMPLRAMKWVL